MSFVRTMADFSLSLNRGSVPQEVWNKTREITFDWFSVCLGGNSQPIVHQMMAFAEQLGGVPQASIVGGHRKLSAPMAALVNGTSAHSLDYDDTVIDCALHPASVVVSAAMAVGEWQQKSVAEVMTAIIAGYEVMVRIGRTVNIVPHKAHHAQGFHPTGTCGTFGAAAAAGKLLGLNAEQMAHALGISSSFSSGLLEFLSNGASVKRVHPGWAAQGGIHATLMAREGVTGPLTALEGRDGFFRAFSSRSDASYMTDKLGSDYAVLGSAIKLYPACHHCHPPIDALYAMQRMESFEASQIASIRIHHPGPSHYLIGEPEEKKQAPSNMLEAQMSLPYCVAVALIDGKLSPDQFTGERLDDPEVRSLMSKVKSIPDPELDRLFSAECWPARVHVQLNDGRKLRGEIDAPKGFPNVPASWQDLEHKLIGLASLSSDQARRCASTLRDAADEMAIGDLMRVFQE